MSISQIQQSVKIFAQKHILPFSKKWDKGNEFPKEFFKELGNLGVLGIFLPEQYGAANLTYKDYVDALVELAKADPSISLSVAAHNSLIVNHIYKFGTEEQKNKYLPKLVSGEWLGAWALTEPNSGSDAGAVKTFAENAGNGFVLTGSKNFITHGSSAQIMLVIADTDFGKSAFLIERPSEGLKAFVIEGKLGMNASETAEVFLNHCHIPSANLVGKMGEGFKQALQILDGGRISIAALSLGIATGAYEEALTYAKQRIQFGKPIIEHQAIGFMLAEMATELEAARLLVYRAATLMDEQQSVTISSAMAKLYASEAAVHITGKALHILGGNGYTKEYRVEKFYRDARLCTIGEGTSEIQKMIISRGLTK